MRTDFVPYPAMLPVLNHYFFRAATRSIESAEHGQQLEYWFWRAAFGERYSGASQTRMNEDGRWIRQLLSEGESCPEYPIVNERRLLNVRMSQTSAIRNGMLCLLNTLSPLDFRSKQKVALAGDHFSKFTLAERHHIFPVGLLKQQGFDARAGTRHCQLLLHPSDTNKWIGDRPPSEYMREVRNMYSSEEAFQSVMRTHLIPVGPDSGVWTDDYLKFLQQRASLLMDEIKLRCGITTSLQPERRDPVVNKIEIALRDTIHSTMLAHGADYWKHKVPGDVKKRVQESINKYIDKTPGANRSDFNDPRRLLDYCDVSDYSRIIVNGHNWMLFAPIFKSKPDCEHFLNDFREFRALLKHNHED